ncbi:PREDICTED: uncharacterized protein LOC109236786 isoform X2 [Nicotiana attenuata]|uniref:Ribosomal protein L34Ae n=1 Tax=Nicotiana attenuata TaxID=49451 RepID=A0A314LFC1_NICAT|nr:PREDICTED: uncharacterized protein LOC109236786 isoform X2 [Nicotiana attenuata]OIT40450.1 hypothetical protein A4A49_14986 [Nicotiana attenuata]
MASLSRFLYQNLFLSLTTAFASVSTYLSPLFSFITTFFLRLRRGNASLNKNPDFKEDYKKESAFSEAERQLDSESEAFKDASEFPDSENNGEVQKTEFSFTFRFPSYEEFCKSREEKGEFVSSKWMPSTCNHKSLTETEVVETEDLKEVHSKSEAFNEEEKGNSGNLTCDEEEMEKSEELNSVKGESNISDEFLFESEKDSLTDSDSVSIGFEHIRYLMNKLVDQYSDGFLTDEDFGGEFEHNEKLSDFEMSEENQESEDSDSDIMEELRKLEHDQAQQFLSEDDFQETVKLRNEDANKLETLWEHQELIEQLKMELRKVRDTGLPTILEESESLKMEDLQPWKIEEKFQREDCMTELHKFYKSYRERMRKFDILTYQKMYAIGYLQKDPLNDPFQHISSQKSSGPKLKSLISQNIRLLKHKRHDNIDPMVKFIKELQSDLEVIYVAQMCLSWEFLHWQYGKALSLWDSDPRGVRTYNEVAGEFQQFQVLLQRFIENEPFQGPRVQYYIKSRYDLRNLLQVPVIREDRMKAKNKARAGEKDDYFITSDMLVEIMEESIRIFWQFVRADRNCSNMMVKGQNRKRREFQAPEDLELLMDVKRSLEKKEKKLKHALRGECCILRRFRKHTEDDDSESDHVLYFFSQVDMKLVARVLNMSRLTKDQLVWCHNKLSRISFVHRKIYVDASFLLFPC